jgi:hypothetical protein
MSATPKTPREIPTEEALKNVEFMDNVAALYKKGVECVADLENRAIDCALQHNKETLELWKQMAEKLPWAPRLSLFQGFAEPMDRFAEVQKAAIHLAVDETRLFLEMVKERTASANKTADTMSKFAQQNFERSVAAQRKVAEATVAGTKSAFENARERFTVPGGEAISESIRQSIDTVIDAQKELLETVSGR